MHKIINSLLFCCLTMILCGCSTLTYTGEDYSSDNSETIKTNEDFVFNTYKKTIDNTNLKIGISKTPVAEILSLYIKVENLSHETPYTFKVDDLSLDVSGREVKFITSNNYLSIYQEQEASSMNAMSSVGATISNMSGLATQGYNEVNQGMIQNATESTNKSAFARMEYIGNKILAHSVRYSSVISPRKSQYYYFFFENPEESPINVKYKTLNYQFKL